MPNDIDEMLRRADAPRPQTPTRSDKSPASKETDTPRAKAAKETAAQPRPKADQFITGIYLALCVISVVELYSASSREVVGSNVFSPLIRHVITLLMGIAICFGVSRLKMSTIVRYTPAFIIVSILMMAYVLLFGKAINGALRSISLAGFQIQPSEFLKISAVLAIAYIMARNQIKGGGVKTRGVVITAIVVIIFGAMLFSQGLTNTLLLMAISLSMMVIGGIEWKKFGLVLLFYLLMGGAGMYVKMKDANRSPEEIQHIIETGRDFSGKPATVNRGSIWQGRMSSFTNDSIPKYKQPITADNRQEMYSYMAQANGGILGVLPGNSRETARLPLAFSDYIYSIVVEDWGFVGGVILLAIYISLLLRAGGIASRCDRAFPAMLEMGMAVMIMFQALFHMAITTGVFPVSGQPLPMISKGGTSMLITSLAFGIMLCVSRYAARKKGKKKETPLKVDLPADLDAANPSRL